MSRFVAIPETGDIGELRRLVNDNFRRMSGVASGGGTVVNNTSLSSTTINGGAAAPWYSITFATPFTVDKANGKNQRITLTGDATLADPVGWSDGDELTLRLTQDATGGRTVNRATPAKWELPDGFTLYALANRIITITWIFDAMGVGNLKHAIQI